MKRNYARGHIFIACSLDGFVAKEDDSLDWLMKYNTDDAMKEFLEFSNRMDALVMGSGTFKKVLSFDTWPYEMPVYVLSKTLDDKDIPEAIKHKASISRFEPNELMEDLHSKGLKEIYVDGGKLAQSFIREGLVDHITISQIPILIGSGKALFGELDNDVSLELIESKEMKLGILQNHYQVKKSS